MRAGDSFGDGATDPDGYNWPGTAADGIAILEHGFTAWRKGLDTIGDARVWEKLGPKAGPFSEARWIQLILHKQPRGHAPRRGDRPPP